MKLNPFFEVILAAVIWSFTGPFIKFMGLPVTTLSFLRVTIPVILLFAYFRLRKIKFLHKTTKTVVFASLINAIRLYLIFLAFSLTALGNAYLMFYTWPIFFAIFAFFYLKRKDINKRQDTHACSFCRGYTHLQQPKSLTI